jgi:hypothetical protein
MINKYEVKEHPGKTNELYHKGQHIVYKGEDAEVLEVKPIFTIRVIGVCHVICGNILRDDIRPSVH